MGTSLEASSLVMFVYEERWSNGETCTGRKEEEEEEEEEMEEEEMEVVGGEAKGRHLD